MWQIKSREGLAEEKGSCRTEATLQPGEIIQVGSLRCKPAGALSAEESCDRILETRFSMTEQRQIEFDVEAVLLSGLCVFLWLSLMSFDAADSVSPVPTPLNYLVHVDSQIYPANDEIQNACGWIGAFTAMTLLQARLQACLACMYERTMRVGQSRDWRALRKRIFLKTNFTNQGGRAQHAHDSCVSE